ncbi:LysR family transcriptional regulator [Microvirga sp. VF16]|uniref:LysR family transcriptional regulator n=1 Tax=Microvirga sp. VF16 TaxID=2807101 RepID=UPI00193CD37E|nr:LysR family transcriptional regulator [Microvirga sp. VF16]QRM33163.1 LysR family transcriptional regulator [Microvirga sp. VF16]
MLDPKGLRILVELNSRGTITAVAEALAFSLSAISQRLAQLEIAAGVPLTERVGRRLLLTEAGQRLVAHATGILAKMEEAETELELLSGSVSGVLRIASLETTLGTVLPKALPVMERRYPNLKIETQEMDPEVAIPALIRGSFDAILIDDYRYMRRSRPPELILFPLCSDPILIAFPVEHVLAGEQQEFNLGDLASEVWISTNAGSEFSELHAYVCSTFGGFRPDVRHRTDNFGVSLALVANGCGLALVPGLATLFAPPGVVFRRPADFSTDRTVCFAIRETSSARPALTAFQGVLEEVAANLKLAPPKNDSRMAATSLAP